MDETQRLNERASRNSSRSMTCWERCTRRPATTEKPSSASNVLRRSPQSSNTGRLRKIADIAEAAGDRPKVINTLKRVVERTRKSSMLKVDDYLMLTRVRCSPKNASMKPPRWSMSSVSKPATSSSGKWAAKSPRRWFTVARDRWLKRRRCLDKVFALFDRRPGQASDTMAVEIAEEAAQHGEAERATTLIAKVSIKSALPTRIKSRLNAWFGSDSESAGRIPTRRLVSRKAMLAEQIVQSMSESIAHLERKLVRRGGHQGAREIDRRLHLDAAGQTRHQRAHPLQLHRRQARRNPPLPDNTNQTRDHACRFPESGSGFSRPCANAAGSVNCTSSISPILWLRAKRRALSETFPSAT
jgi:hypothetical protein